MKEVKTHILGYPRIGNHRELKKATEAYWKQQISQEELQATGKKIRSQNWKTQLEKGLSGIPCNDFSFYDQMLDASCLIGNVPPRFGWSGGLIDETIYFAMARGTAGAHACEMTKWFDTNYHFIVPELYPNTNFKISSRKIFEEFTETKALGIKSRPVLIGPLTYLFLAKEAKPSARFNRWALLESITDVYIQALSELQALGAEWVQIDEPILSLDLPKDILALFQKTYSRIKKNVPSLNYLLATYFGELRENFSTVAALPVDAIHIDAVRGENEFDAVLKKWPRDKILSLGIIDGRNIWKTNYEKALPKIKKAIQALGEKKVWLAPSCSLLHVPLSLKEEKNLGDPSAWFSFAEEKLVELQDLAKLATQEDSVLLRNNREIFEQRSQHVFVSRPAVRERTSQIKEEDLHRLSPFSTRQIIQKKRFDLPLFPTTTIGSFPQSPEVRSWRAQLKNGALTSAAYDEKIKCETESCIRRQEKIGLDVLVHGEFERNDMVEYFGEALSGFVFTANGWVQSYGTRCVKPPIIYADVLRPFPMTVSWAEYAQSLTKKPMKGMLTGPVTILQWSFVRDDLSRKDVAFQLGLAIRDEVQDLEKAGISIIQIDEPALREGLPLRQNEWKNYLSWAVQAFRLSSSGVKDETQIHTHMCYSEFNDIIQAIADLDADVITIETSRSNMELLNAFESFAYPNEIGPGVYDIHSPRVPSAEIMADLIEKASRKIPFENLWVNPDCGLKTRGWPEVEEALSKMVAAAKMLREKKQERLLSN